MKNRMGKLLVPELSTRVLELSKNQISVLAAQTSLSERCTISEEYLASISSVLTDVLQRSATLAKAVTSLLQDSGASPESTKDVATELGGMVDLVSKCGKNISVLSTNHDKMYEDVRGLVKRYRDLDENQKHLASAHQDLLHKLAPVLASLED